MRANYRYGTAWFAGVLALALIGCGSSEVDAFSANPSGGSGGQGVAGAGGSSVAAAGTAGTGGASAGAGASSQAGAPVAVGGTGSVPLDGPTITIASAGDWDDGWNGGDTELNLKRAGEHDLVAMLGDLSYGDNGLGVANAQDWATRANAAAGGGTTPLIFVPGDHDSIAQDGDITTYANGLTPPDGVLVSAPNTAGYGMYPFLYYVDVKREGVAVRIVGTSLAFEEPEVESAERQKYFTDYGQGSANYQWLGQVYAEAKAQGMWLLHINHLPCIDMGKNKSFDDCEDLVNLDVEAGVNILLDGSSHNVWRTKQLVKSDACPKITLTSSAGGPAAACAKDTPDRVYVAADGLINAHAGTGGKDEASDGPNCDPAIDAEVLHYAAPGACYNNGVPGIVSMKIGEHGLTAEFIKSDGSKLPEYGFALTR